MSKKQIIYVPGKDPKPPADQHIQLLWKALLEGVRRSSPEASDDLGQYFAYFKLISWNYLYYQTTYDPEEDVPWIDAMIEKSAPTVEDIREARAWDVKLLRFLYSIIDYFPFLLKFLSKDLQAAAEDTQEYFKNKNNVGCDIREILKRQLRPLLEKEQEILLIGHSLGSVIAYDALWELSHYEKLPGKVDTFLTLGSPLGLNYIQHRLVGHQHKGKNKYPSNIKKWINVSSIGDITALDRTFADDYAEMTELKLVESITDHKDDIYNYYRGNEGLNCHRSYGYFINDVVGSIIANWWKGEEPSSENEQAGENQK
ncbi:MAG: GPI inositol-deacylase [Gammaproteobacteria bacterium]|nr:GPI inositol-deacylase [Gammaproteobacteria bacterium]MDH5630456.1 GPI inositol-deacylase [Gammaproteobacteria bacterium]